MHNQVTPTAPVTLRERLRATGHEWAADEIMGKYSEHDYRDPSTVVAITNELAHRIYRWDVTGTRSEVRMMVYDFAAHKRHIDLDGRTAAFPPNRAQEVQTSYGMNKKIVTEVLGGIAIDTWPDGAKSGRVLRS